MNSVESGSSAERLRSSYELSLASRRSPELAAEHLRKVVHAVSGKRFHVRKFLSETVSIGVEHDPKGSGFLLDEHRFEALTEDERPEIRYYGAVGLHAFVPKEPRKVVRYQDFLVDSLYMDHGPLRSICLETLIGVADCRGLFVTDELLDGLVSFLTPEHRNRIRKAALALSVLAERGYVIPDLSNRFGELFSANDEAVKLESLEAYDLILRSSPRSLEGTDGILSRLVEAGSNMEVKNEAEYLLESTEKNSL
ncbi:MAG: hypothetical protein ABEK59_10385 [Halobacteria archaeon]